MEAATATNGIMQLTKDLREAAEDLGDAEARYLVDTYYEIQGHRIRSGNQAFALRANEQEPNAVFQHLLGNMLTLEKQVASALDRWSAQSDLGEWAREQIGIGPVLAAGLLALVNIRETDTAGKVWAYAGLAPGQRRRRGEKLGYNPTLKTLCWKIGDSFVKTSGHERSFYGPIYRQRKEYEQAKNEAGDYADQAATALKERKIGKDTEAFKWYSDGKLPPGHIDNRCRRYAVKLFLAHYFEVGYELEYGKAPPLPYPIAHQDHVDQIPPPRG